MMSLKSQPALSCGQCRATFTSKAKMTSHMKIHLPSTSGETTKKKKVTQIQKTNNPIVTLTPISNSSRLVAKEEPQAMNLTMSTTSSSVSMLAGNKSIEIIPLATPISSNNTISLKSNVSRPNIIPSVAVKPVIEPSLAPNTPNESKPVNPIIVPAFPVSISQVSTPSSVNEVGISALPVSKEMKVILPINPAKECNASFSLESMPKSAVSVTLDKVTPSNMSNSTVPVTLEKASTNSVSPSAFPVTSDQVTTSSVSKPTFPVTLDKVTTSNTSKPVFPVTLEKVTISSISKHAFPVTSDKVTTSSMSKTTFPVSSDKIHVTTGSLSKPVVPVTLGNVTTNNVPKSEVSVALNKDNISSMSKVTIPETLDNVTTSGASKTAVSSILEEITTSSVTKSVVPVTLDKVAYPVALIGRTSLKPVSPTKGSTPTLPLRKDTSCKTMSKKHDSAANAKEPAVFVGLVKASNTEVPVPIRMARTTDSVIPVSLVKASSPSMVPLNQPNSVIPVCLSKAVSIIPINLSEQSRNSKTFFSSPNGSNTNSSLGPVPLNIVPSASGRGSSPKKIHKCNLCEKVFVSSSNLKRHESSCKIIKETQVVNNNDLHMDSDDSEEMDSDDDGEIEDIDADDLSGDEDFNPNRTMDKFQESLRGQMRGKVPKRSHSLMTKIKPKKRKMPSKEPKKIKKAKVPKDPKGPKAPEKSADPNEQIDPAKKVKPAKPKKERVKKVKVPSPEQVQEKSAEMAAMQLMEMGPKEEELECPHCGVHASDRESFIQHLAVHTGMLGGPPSVLHTCNMCNKSFTRKYHLDRHLLMTACSGQPPPAHMCQVCEKVYTRKDNLREHLRAHAGEVLRRKKYKCDFCEKHFHGLSLLKIHERLHTGEKPFQCDFCSKAFPSTGALTKHRRIHTGEKPYVCNDCGIGFALKGTLNRHTRIHTGVRPHKCQYCGKEFIQAGGLKAHLFFHTGENGFKCDECNKSFNRKSRLQMHMRYVHEKVKPHECDNCGKAFTRKEDLLRHTVLHTGEKPFVCPTCNKCFAIKPSLKLHLLTHTKEEPRSCHECGRAFIRKDCLLRHMRKRHRDLLDKILADESEEKVHDDDGQGPVRIFTEQTMCASIKELLSLLVDETTLKGFGWPDKPVDELLEAVIRRCGHTPVNPDDYSYIDRLRENSKLLFTVVIDDNAVKTLLNNQTVDEVILHVLRLAKT